MRHVAPRPEARFVLVHAENGFTTNLPLADFLGEDCLFAWSHDGRPLDPDHGWPLRLVVPRLYAWKSAKWVRGVEFLESDRPGFWEQNGYHNHGDPWTLNARGRNRPSGSGDLRPPASSRPPAVPSRPCDWGMRGAGVHHVLE